MNELLQMINTHKDKNDITICYVLFNYILHNKISSVQKLKEYEDSHFDTEDMNERIQKCYHSFLLDTTHLDELDTYEKTDLLDYRDLFEETKDMDVRLKCIIHMYHILKWDFMFPYQTYRLIMEDKLK